MIKYLIEFTDKKGTHWYNMKDTMQDALEFATSKPVGEVSRIDIQEFDTDTFANTRWPFPVGEDPDSGDEVHG